MVNSELRVRQPPINFFVKLENTVKDSVFGWNRMFLNNLEDIGWYLWLYIIEQAKVRNEVCYDCELYHGFVKPPSYLKAASLR